MIKSLKILLTTLFVFCFSAHLVFATNTWVEEGPFVGFNIGWRAVASDSDGSNFVAAVNNGRLYTSDDGGATWNERQPAGAANRSWRVVASDSDGSNLVAAENSGRLYTSDDFGATWDERQPAGAINKSWASVASDADGSNLIAAVENGRLYTSDDGGATWDERQPAGDTNKYWEDVASDADGSNLIVGATDLGDGDRLYTSDDGGVTWDERQPAGDVDQKWWSVASDADGSHLVAGQLQGRLYTSDDFGATWNETQPAGDVNGSWYGLDSSDDGTHLIAGAYGERLWLSDDGGVDWIETQPAGDIGKNWVSVDLDADGSNMIAVGAIAGRLYVYPDLPNITTLDPIDGAIEVDLNATFSITFEQDIATSTGDIVLYDASDDSVVETIDAAGPLVSLSGTDALVIDPSVTLELGTGYYFLIDAGTIEDLSGNPFAGISDPTTWNFTADAAPTSGGFTPGDNETGVAIDFSRFDLYFDQTVVAGTGNITLYKTSDDSVVETFDVTDADAVTVDSSLVSLFPTVILENETEYYFLVDATAIEDENGNTFAGISDPTTWSFTTRPPFGTPTFDFERISVNSGEEEGAGNDGSFTSVISNDGRYVAFVSYDSGLVEEEVSGDGALYLRDRTLGTTELISDTIFNTAISMSGDGRYIVFTSALDDLVEGDTNGWPDVFVYDRDLDNFERVSVDSNEQEEVNDSRDGYISEDGRYVTFQSYPIIEGRSYLRIRDRELGITENVNVNSDEEVEEYNGSTNGVQFPVSADGRYVVFIGFGANLTEDVVSGNGATYLRDRELGTTILIADSYLASSQILSMTPDGKFITFNSSETDLTEDVVGGDGAVFVYDVQEETISLIVDGVFSSDISDDGVYVVYIAEDEDEVFQVYRYNTQTESPLLITEGADGDEGFSSQNSALSANGSFVVFSSDAANLVLDDTNTVSDIFLWTEPETEDEEEDNDTGGRNGSSGGHRQSVSPVTVVQDIQDIQEATKIAIMEKIIVLLKQLLEQLLAGQTV